jgi:hypothetical protein
MNGTIFQPHNQHTSDGYQRSERTQYIITQHIVNIPSGNEMIAAGKFRAEAAQDWKTAHHKANGIGEEANKNDEQQTLVGCRYHPTKRWYYKSAQSSQRHVGRT